VGKEEPRVVIVYGSRYFRGPFFFWLTARRGALLTVADVRETGCLWEQGRLVDLRCGRDFGKAPGAEAWDKLDCRAPLAGQTHQRLRGSRR
jgi:hypothetical protein